MPGYSGCMSNTNHRIGLLIATLAFLAIASVACSGDSDGDAKSISESTVANFATCEGFIDASTVESQTGVSGLIDRIQVIDVASIPGLAESGATDNCLIEVFRTVDSNDSPAPGDSVSVSLVRFEVVETAALLYNSTLAAGILTAEQIGDLGDIQQGVVGNDSYLMVVDAGGVGAIVVFVHGSVFISMSSATNADGNALLDREALVTAAQGVQSRLP